LTVSLTADDANRDLALVIVRTLDAKGAPIRAVDFGAASEKTLVLDPLAAARGTRMSDVVVLPEAYPVSLQFRPTQVSVELVDLAGLRSTVKTVPIAPQPEVASGEPCDVAEARNRCPEGLACAGSPAVCGEAGAPAIDAAAYFRTPSGANLVVEGTAPADDLATLHVRFLDKEGEPFAPDFDGDGSPDESDLLSDVTGLARRGRFHLVIEPTAVFAELVPQLGLVATDSLGRDGPERRVRLDERPVRAAGEACRPDGLDRCAETLFCDADAATPDCVSKAELVKRRCAASRGLDPGAGRTRTTGRVRGSASVVDVPTDCLPGNPVGQPEGLVPLHLAAEAPSLVLSTDAPATTFDTNLILFAGSCDALPSLEPVASCDGAPCCADGPTEGAVLTLTGLPAGEYVVVVDSYGREAGDFALEARVDAAPSP
jgi:hypothetical protein